MLNHNLRNGGDLGVRHRDIDAWLEEDLDDAHTGVGVGFDVLNVVDRGGQAALKQRGNAASHLVGWQTGVLPGHGDHRDPYFRENVGWGA